jgi:hypothetical protein
MPRIGFTFCAMLCAAFAGCTTLTSVTGRVTDPFGQPIPGARVVLDSTYGNLIEYAVTEQDGSYSVLLSPSPVRQNLSFIVLCDGYEPYRETVVGGTDAENHNVTLKPEKWPRRNGNPYSEPETPPIRPRPSQALNPTACRRSIHIPTAEPGCGAARTC